MTALAPILQGFFTDKLIRQRRAGQNTLAAYRDTCRLLLQFASRTTATAPSGLDLAQIDAGLVTAFLTHLETARGNTVATRNARLAAIHSLFRYAALRAPEHADQIARVLAIPPKRCDRAVVSFLTSTEIDALLAAPDRTTRLGRRDHALLLLACQTGLRVSELIALTRGDIHLDQHGAHVRCDGKGRKERATPLTRQTVAALRVWLAEHQGGPADPVFTTGAGRRLSRDAVAKLVRKHAASAATTCPGIAAKKISPHTLRHSRWRCCTPGSTPRSSRSGLATRTPARRRPTCTPTWASRRKPSPASNPRITAPAATGRQTPCSPSLTTSDPDHKAGIMPTTRPRSPPSTSTVTPRSA